jgi:hypothetical protein
MAPPALFFAPIVRHRIIDGGHAPGRGRLRFVRMIGAGQERWSRGSCVALAPSYLLPICYLLTVVTL